MIAQPDPPSQSAIERLAIDRIGAPLESIEPLSGGAWSSAWGVRVRDRDLVIRWSVVDEDFHKDERATHFGSPALPVPRVLEIGPAHDGWYAISERHFGDVLEELDAPATRAVLPSLLGMLDALRSAPISDSQGFGPWDATGDGIHPSWKSALLAIGTDSADRRSHGWRARLDERPSAAAVFEAAYASLTGLAPDLPETRHVIHGDLLNRNVLVENDQISAVLDWGSAMYGDFLFDVAWFDFWSAWHRQLQEVGVVQAALDHLESAGVDLPQRDARLFACNLFVGLDGISYLAWRGWDEPLDWTTRRLAEILDLGPTPRPDR